jgi:pimeloyl-ACP methyl ester carboxylesterase
MANLYASQRGEGKPLILIHGFPLHQAVWNDFGSRLVHACRIITVDLPGFGKSPLLPQPFSIDQVADQLNHYLSEEGIVNGTVIGHSLGGYVALAMISKRPDLFSAAGLFHSTAYPDSPEKKESRTKVIEFVEKNGPLPFVTNFIGPLFVHPGNPAIETVRKIAMESSKDAVIGYTTAMRDRPDHTKTLKTFEKPTLFLAGDKDAGIPADTIQTQARICQRPEIHILPDVAHMGMFEKPEEAASKILGFLSKI